MKKILVILILMFGFQALASAGTLNLSNGITVDASFNANGVTRNNSPARGGYFNQTTNNSNIITSEAICSAINNCVNFNGSNYSTGTVKNGLVRYFYNTTQTQFALQVRALDVGWQYQSFGVWANSVNGSGTASAGSFGTVITPGTSIPKSGSATYTGLLAGILAQGSSNKLFVAADMTAGVNFASRSINFASTNSIASSSLNGIYSSAPGLNMSGTLTYLGNTNGFSGTVRTSGLTVLTGTAGGQFYGPAAQEIGGVFALRNGNIGFIGGFGGKK